MVNVIVSLILVFASVVASVDGFIDNKLSYGILWGVLAFILLVIVVFRISPSELGNGHVTKEAENNFRRLKKDRMYYIEASKLLPNGDSILLLSQEFPIEKVRSYHAIKIKKLKASEIVPDHFTLKNEKPIKVAKPFEEQVE